MSRVALAEAALGLSGGSNRARARLTLRELRERSGRTIRQLEAEVGISRGTLSQIETGARTPTAAELLTLAAHYGVPLERCRFVTLATFEVEA